MDPDTYVLAIALVLSAYDDWVILEATHPRTGIQATEKFKSWPPNSGELKDFCDDMAKRAARYAVYDKLPRADFTPRLPPFRSDAPGRCANCWVSEFDVNYAAMVMRSKDADPKDWCWFKDHPKYGTGIKVPFDWYPPRGGAARFKPEKQGFRPVAEVAAEWSASVAKERLPATPDDAKKAS